MKLCYLLPYWEGNFEFIYKDESEIPDKMIPYVDGCEVIEAFVNLETETLVVRLDI